MFGEYKHTMVVSISRSVQIAIVQWMCTLGQQWDHCKTIYELTPYDAELKQMIKSVALFTNYLITPFFVG